MLPSILNVYNVYILAELSSIEHMLALNVIYPLGINNNNNNNNNHSIYVYTYIIWIWTSQLQYVCNSMYVQSSKQETTYPRNEIRSLTSVLCK